MRQADRGRSRDRKERDLLPALFNAAGLIVPGPAKMSLPMPFADVETGCEVEYMAGRSTRDGRSRLGAPAVDGGANEEPGGQSWVAAFNDAT